MQILCSALLFASTEPVLNYSDSPNDNLSKNDKIRFNCSSFGCCVCRLEVIHWRTNWAWQSKHQWWVCSSLWRNDRCGYVSLEYIHQIVAYSFFCSWFTKRGVIGNMEQEVPERLHPSICMCGAMFNIDWRWQRTFQTYPSSSKTEKQAGKVFHPLLLR